MPDRPVVPAPSEETAYEPHWFKVAVWSGNRTVTECSGFNTRITLVFETKRGAVQ